jgi:hypothetical protein
MIGAAVRPAREARRSGLMVSATRHLGRDGFRPMGSRGRDALDSNRN